MRAELHLARRYLIGLGRRSNVATVTLISLVGLGLGVVALVVTLALLEGFQSSIRRDLVEQTSHAQVQAASGRILDRSDQLASLLHDSLPDVEIVSSVRGNCLVASVVDAVPALLVGRSDVDGVMADHVLAARLGLGAGGVVDVISPRQRLTPLGPVPVRARVDVREVSAGTPGMEGGVLRVPIEVAQRILWGSPEVETLELKDPSAPWQLGETVREVLKGREDVVVLGLADLNRPLLLALALERILIFIAVGLILVVAALNLLCNVAMLAAEKRRDLAVLTSLGLEPVRVRRLFLLLGLAIGAAGAFGGATVGVLTAWILDTTGALPLPRGVFVVSSVPFSVDPVMVAKVVALTLLMAAVASWLPSRVVARREPAEGLRYE
jgi:lipoprotein-releasing system permease protein